MNEQDEALHVAAQILQNVARGKNFREHAVLYRMNAQSNQLEMAFKRNSIPSKVIGGTRFFERAEIKDMLAYLCFLQNPDHTLLSLLILHSPPRGIRANTLDVATDITPAEGVAPRPLLVQPHTYLVLTHTP